MQESDWKYLRRIQPELIDKLCARINAKTNRILTSPNLTEHERFKKVFDHIQESDDVIAECFDDWRRSNLELRCLGLIQHELLEPHHMEHLSDDLRARLRAIINL